MSNKGIHPAIVELRKFLHQKGDLNLAAFMQRWMATWLEVGLYETKVVGDHWAYKALGNAIGPECVDKEEVPDESSTPTFRYSLLAMRTKKKLVLEES